MQAQSQKRVAFWQNALIAGAVASFAVTFIALAWLVLIYLGLVPAGNGGAPENRGPEREATVDVRPSPVQPPGRPAGR